MKELTIKWTGIRPMLMHNGEMADPRSRHAKEIKKITDKGAKKITISDLDNRDRLEWEGGLYWREGDGPFIPADNIEACIQEGAAKFRKKKDFQAALFCAEPEYALNYEGPRDKDELYSDGRYALRVGIRVQRNRVMRVRPMFPTGWSLVFNIEYDDTVLNLEMVMDACLNAGSLVGLGDWRPKFGRFLVERI